MTAPWVDDDEVECEECDGTGVIDVESDVPWETDVEDCPECSGHGEVEWCSICQQVLSLCEDIAACVRLMAAIDETMRADEAIFGRWRRA